jgi:ABC-type dipeptide/oligopeptide/nickel transport system ATPase component
MRSENDDPPRTVVFIFGETGIGKSMLYKSIIKGNLRDINIDMNPKEFNGANRDRVESLSEYQIFVNEEAAIKVNSKLSWAALKKMWEGKQHINIKFSAIQALY